MVDSNKIEGSLHPWGNQDTPIDEMLCWLMCAEGHYSNFKEGVSTKAYFFAEMDEVLKEGKRILIVSRGYWSDDKS